MSKQDRTYSRTPEDLERKYNLGQLVQGGNSKEVEELKNNISELTESFSVQKNIDSQISFTQPTSSTVTVNSIRAWTKGNICGVSMSLTNTGSWAVGGTVDIPISGFPKPIFITWNIGLVIGANFIGAYTTTANNQIRLRNLGASAIAPFESFNIVFTYTI